MAETSSPEMVTLDVACDCAGCCSIMRLSRWTDDPELYVDWYTSYDVTRGLWGRIKIAVKVLLKREECRHGSVLYPENVERVRQWLNAQAAPSSLTANPTITNLRLESKGENVDGR